MKDKVHVREVGPRDGLQMVARQIPTDVKLDWCRTVASAGLRDIEVTSFVPPHVMPQFADAEAVARSAASMDGFRAAALVPNLKGAMRAFETGLEAVNFVLSASEAHNQANVRRSSEESLREFADIVAARDQRDVPRVKLGGCIATAFGCTIQGEVPVRRVIEIATRYAEMGADEIVVADTVGYGDPAQVKGLIAAIVAAVAPLKVACHFHDTRGLGLANIVAATEAGVRDFDASLGGLGGCPFAPGASGNVATEDVIFLLETIGFDTGADLQALIEARDWLEGALPGEHFSGAIARAGIPKNFGQRQASAWSGHIRTPGERRG